MKRKVIKQGHNTLTITLPSKWVKKYNIQASDELEFQEQGGSLVIHTENGQDVSETAIVDVTGLTIPLLWRYVSSAYRSGCDEIKIIFDEATDFKHLYTAFSYDTLQPLYKEPNLTPVEAIQALVNRFIGVEIIDQKKNYCIIRELGETTYKEFNNAVRRIFLLLLHLAEESTTAIEKGDYRTLKSIHLVDTNLDRFEDFCLRVLNKRGYVDFKKTPTVYSLIFLLELIGDEYKRISLHILESKNLRRAKLVPLFKIQESQLRRSYDLFYNFNKEKLLEIFDKDVDEDKLIKQSYGKLNDEEKELTHHLKKIGVHLKSLAELRIDMEF